MYFQNTKRDLDDCSLLLLLSGFHIVYVFIFKILQCAIQNYYS